MKSFAKIAAALALIGFIAGCAELGISPPGQWQTPDPTNVPG